MGRKRRQNKARSCAKALRNKAVLVKLRAQKWHSRRPVQYSLNGRSIRMPAERRFNEAWGTSYDQIREKAMRAGVRGARRSFPGRHVDYDVYMRSPEWRAMRLKIIERDGGDCQSCGGPGNHVHHLHYETFGRETGHELVLLCRVCHANEHGEPIAKRRAFWEAHIARRAQALSA